MGTEIHGDRLSIENRGAKFMGTRNSWGQVIYREPWGKIHGQIHGDRLSIENRGANSWGQVIYREPWGNRPFGTHPVCSCGSVARRLTLSTDLSAPNNSWGQVIYREPWGNRPFGTHPVCSSGSVARRLTLSTDLSAPGTGIQEFMGTGYLSRTVGQSPFRHSSGLLLRVSCTAVNPFDRP